MPLVSYQITLQFQITFQIIQPGIIKFCFLINLPLYLSLSNYALLAIHTGHLLRFEVVQCTQSFEGVIFQKLLFMLLQLSSVFLKYYNSTHYLIAASTYFRTLPMESLQCIWWNLEVSIVQLQTDHLIVKAALLQNRLLANSVRVT